MPAHIHLIFAGPAPALLEQGAEFRHANGLRAMVYDCLAGVDPGFAQDMHDDTWPKPLTLSPLWWRDGCWELDICVLLEQVGSLLLQGLAAHDPMLRLGREEYHLQEVRLGESTTIAEIMAVSAPASRLMVDFITPTTYQDTLIIDPLHKTKVSYPFPDPTRMVTSWYHKWNCLLGRMQQPPIPDAFLELLPRLALSRMHGETQEIRLGEKQRLVGFVGAAVFDVIGAATAPEELTTTLSQLANFANYAGTGVETFRGMGQTRAAARWHAR